MTSLVDAHVAVLGFFFGCGLQPGWASVVIFSWDRFALVEIHEARAMEEQIPEQWIPITSF